MAMDKKQHNRLLGLASLGLVVAGAVLLSVIERDPTGISALRTTIDDHDPIVLTPEKQPIAEAQSTIVVAKTTDLQTVSAIPSDAPKLQGALAPKGFAVDLGSSLSFAELSKRFANIVKSNASVEFDKFEPRAHLRDTASGLQARLLVGPLATLDDAKALCEKLALPASLECFASPFEGERISRQ